MLPAACCIGANRHVSGQVLGLRLSAHRVSVTDFSGSGHYIRSGLHTICRSVYCVHATSIIK